MVSSLWSVVRSLSGVGRCVCCMSYVLSYNIVLLDSLSRTLLYDTIVSLSFVSLALKMSFYTILILQIKTVAS